MYDSPKYGIRFDHSPSKFGSRGTMTNNVVWNTKGIMVKGDRHNIVGNVALDNTSGYQSAGSLLVIHILRREPPVHNKNTVVENNAASQADGGINMHTSYPFGRYPLAGRKTNNYSGRDLNQLLVDVENKDFRPISPDAFTEYGTGDIIGDETADVIGPYTPLGENLNHYAIPGQKLSLASNPIPSHGSIVANRDVLIFRPGFRYLVCLSLEITLLNLCTIILSRHTHLNDAQFLFHYY